MLRPQITGWAGLFALGLAALAVFSSRGLLSPALTPEERQVLQRLSHSARSSAKR